MGAMPLLKKASVVVIATVDAIPSAAGHGEAPGRELAAHLARHGVIAEVRNLDGLGRAPERALCDEVMAVDADALVIGAYGHSRAQEFVFGGVTRELLSMAPGPLLLAH
jgi:nucleotide-binding universal stress UspA family protein